MAATPQPNWRDSGSEPSHTTGKASGNRPWQPSDGPAGDSLAPSKRGIKRTIALFALIGIAIIFGAVIIWLRPIAPACLVLVGSGYETNLLLPSNVHGWNGLVHLDKEVAEVSGLGKFWRWDQPTKLRQVGNGPIEFKEGSWSTLWQNINIQNYEEATVVVFLSMHGMADDKDAYLLPNLPSDQALKSFDNSRIPLREVMDSLIAVKKKNVVLLLDVSHVQSYWPIGMLHNDFVKRFQEKYEHEIKGTKHLMVICSASPNQRSWASDELQKTVFGHYVTLGLKGGGHKAKDNVNVQSLFDYLADKVDTWAKTNRARNQKPVLLGGEERARGMALVHVAEPPMDDAPDAAPFPAAKMSAEWNQWQELKTKHAPHVHSPHYWRLYQDSLLRYEQLVRAGDPTGKAAELKQSRLEPLYTEIAVSRSLDRAYKSLGNSFPMHQVLGYPITPPIDDAELQAFLLELRNVFNIKGENDKEKNKVFERFSNRTVQEKQYLQTRLSQLILEQMGRLAMPNRARETLLLTEIEERLRAAHRSTEVQLMKMFRDADPKADEKTVQLALRVRILAEEAALSARGAGNAGELYSEVIFRWFRNDMATADQLRRDGEDHLFGDPKTHGERARKKLDEAETAYRDVRDRAKHLQTALALRDEVSADLPYLAAWLALPHPHQNREAMQTQRMAAEQLGNRLAVLNRDLDDSTRKAPPHPDSLTQIRNDLQSMREKYREICEVLKTDTGLQQTWHGIDAALTAPPLDVRDVGLRVALLSKQRDIAGQLLANKGGQTEEEDAPIVRVERERKLFQASIKSLHEMRAADKDNVDDSVRSFFFKLPEEILAKGELAIDRKDLVAAANLCRGIPGAFVDFVKDETKKRVNPVDRLRRSNMGSLLQWQAERGLEDHWFDPGQETPYYQSAAKVYLTSANDLFDAGQVPNALLNRGVELNKKLAYVDLKTNTPEKLFWMNDPELAFPFKVAADPALPSGTPMVWLEVARGAKIDKVWPRKAVDPWKHPDDKYILDNAQFAGGGEMFLKLHAYYRGQHVKTSTATARPRPDVFVRHTPALKENTSLAVRMDSTFDYGAISIVLDTSGSMAFQHPKVGKKDQPGDLKKRNRRFDYALDALEYLLRKVPPKTEVGIFTFGDNVASPISTFRPSTPWLPEDLGTIRKRLDPMLLDGGSPIADAIIRTMTDGFPNPNFKGPKLIVVLTDGADTTSNVRAGPGRDDRVARLLRDANNQYPDIAVVVVCFIDKESEKEEYDSAEAQFSVVRDFKLKGGFSDVSEGPKLGQNIVEMVRPRVQLLRVGGFGVPGFEKGTPINFRLDQSLAWKQVDPGDYQAHVLQTSPNPLVDLEMPIGQKMFMVLQRRDNKLALQRGVLAFQKEAADRNILFNEKKGWLVSLFENENRGFKAEQLVVIEKKEVDKDRIRQPLPGFAWLELDAVKGAKPDKTLRWWRDWNVPAAGYRLEMDDWAPNRFPKVSTWFWPQEKDDFLRNRALLHTKNYPVPFQAVQQAPLENNSLIESINWREAEIEDANGNKVKKDCLVVRVRHAKGRPVWVDLGSRSPNIGSEHLYFNEAASCTTYFYGLARRDLVDITLMDIADFKNAAQTVDFTPNFRIAQPALFVP